MSRSCQSAHAWRTHLRNCPYSADATYMRHVQHGWFPDPNNSSQLRWWNGQQLTDHVQPPASAPRHDIVVVNDTHDTQWAVQVRRPIHVNSPHHRLSRTVSRLRRRRSPSEMAGFVGDLGSMGELAEIPVIGVIFLVVCVIALALLLVAGAVFFVPYLFAMLSFVAYSVVWVLAAVLGTVAGVVLRRPHEVHVVDSTGNSVAVARVHGSRSARKEKAATEQRLAAGASPVDAVSPRSRTWFGTPVVRDMMPANGSIPTQQPPSAADKTRQRRQEL